MIPATLLNLAIRPTLRWMGEPYDSLDAERFLLAIAMQESNLEHRAQVPVAHAHGYWQFEPIGCAEAIRIDNLLGGRFLRELNLPRVPERLHEALQWSEVGMVVCARLMLWPVPAPLPGPWEQAVGWRQYVRAWKPGKPHPHRWVHAWVTAGQATNTIPETA